MRLFEPLTERLWLRRWRAADHCAFARLNADVRVMAHFPAPLSAQQSDAVAGRLAAALLLRGFGAWAVQERRSGRFIGFVGLAERDAGVPAAPCVEVGWRLARDAWGQGYATEAAGAALRIAFECLDLAEVVSFTVPGNRASWRVMERLGMQRDAQPVDHPGLPAGHPLRPHWVYRLRRHAWQARDC